MEKGQTFTWSRTYTAEEVRTFSQISGDKGEHHILPDEQGRLIVQGLLTATLPSKIGGTSISLPVTCIFSSNVRYIPVIRSPAT